MTEQILTDAKVRGLYNLLIKNGADSDFAEPIDTKCSFTMSDDSKQPIFKILVQPCNYYNARGCYVRHVECSKELIGKAIMEECLKRFITSIRYSMKMLNNGMLTYKYDYLVMELPKDAIPILGIYLTFNKSSENDKIIEYSLQISHD